MRRRSQEAAQQIDEPISRLIAENTYGGSKGGKHVRRKLPVVTSTEGIKMAWDNRADEYPSIIRLRMTDGKWVAYHIALPHPGFTAAMDSLENGNWQTGYPRKKT